MESKTTMKTNSMKNRWTLALAALAMAFALNLPAAPASAQEVQITGPLAGAPACRGCRIYREGRFQLQPLAAFTLTDEFSRTILFGAQLQYHFTDWLGLGLWGGFGAIHIDTNLTDQVVSRGQTTNRNSLSLPSRQGFADQIGTISWIGAAQLTFIPLRGKLALFQKIFIDADFYVFGGAAGVGVEERKTVSAATASSACGEAAFAAKDPALPSPAACLATQDKRASRVAIAPTFGVGLMMYFTDYFGLSLEWRALPFAWNTSGTDEAGSGPDGEFPDGAVDGKDQIFKFNHMVAIGFSFSLPTAVGVSE
ncbi:MAG: hypothetical protein R3A78_01265 [Polyangiales bacterium]